jgi:spore maturation protein SpmA
VTIRDAAGRETPSQVIWTHVLESATGTIAALVVYHLVRKAAAALAWAGVRRRLESGNQARKKSI